MCVYTLKEKNWQKLKFYWIFADWVEWKSYIVEMSTIYECPTIPSAYLHQNLNVCQLFLTVRKVRSGKSEKCVRKEYILLGKNEILLRKSEILSGNKSQCFYKNIIQKYWIICQILSKKKSETVLYISKKAQINFFYTLLQVF